MTLRLRPVPNSSCPVQACDTLQGLSSGTSFPAACLSKSSSTEELHFRLSSKIVELAAECHASPQDARQGLAKLHGEPVRADINDENVKIEGAAGTKPAQRTVLDALVRQLNCKSWDTSHASRSFGKAKANSQLGCGLPASLCR